MDAQMGTIIVRNVPKEVRWTLKEKAASEKKSVNQVILELIGEYLPADGRRGEPAPDARRDWAIK